MRWFAPGVMTGTGPKTPAGATNRAGRPSSISAVTMPSAFCFDRS